MRGRPRHAAGAERREDFVGTEARAGWECQRGVDYMTAELWLDGIPWAIVHARDRCRRDILDIPFVPLEFDLRKSAANKVKHGIDFVEAQALWLDPDRIELPARPMNEPRFLIVGHIKQAIWTATVTYRHEEATRIISVRRARDSEKALYFSAEAS